MNLIEIFDTTLDLTWQTRGRFELSEFIIDNEKVVLQIENKPLFDISPDLKNKITAEISFFIKTGFYTLLNNNKHALKIYSIIANGFNIKIRDYDAIYFKIDSAHSKSNKEYKSKKRIYKALADRFKGNFNNFVYEKRLGINGYGYLLSKEALGLTETLRCTPLEMLEGLKTTLYKDTK